MSYFELHCSLWQHFFLSFYLKITLITYLITYWNDRNYNLRLINCTKTCSSVGWRVCYPNRWSSHMSGSLHQRYMLMSCKCNAADFDGEACNRQKKFLVLEKSAPTSSDVRGGQWSHHWRCCRCFRRWFSFDTRLHGGWLCSYLCICTYRLRPPSLSYMHTQL